MSDRLERFLDWLKSDEPIQWPRWPRWARLSRLVVVGASIAVALFFRPWKVDITLEDFAKTYATPLIAILGFLVLLYRTNIADKQAKTAADGQLTDRFTCAVGQLGNKESLAVRLGGIYALERVAQDSERDHWTVMEVLCAYVRNWSRTKEENAILADEIKAFKDLAPKKNAALSATALWSMQDNLENPFAPPDTQAILDVLKRRKRERETSVQQLDLGGAVLGRANLRGARLGGADLRDADLSGADFCGADICGANLGGADLRFALNLTQAQLDSADGDEGTRLDYDLESDDVKLTHPGRWVERDG